MIRNYVMYICILQMIGELEGSLKMFGEKMETRWKTVVSEANIF